jgi:CO/xanthine dehydrogenase Mo-binding subunit
LVDLDNASRPIGEREPALCPADPWVELVEGAAQVKGAPQATVSIAELAATGVEIIGKGSGRVPEAPATSPDSGCVGRLGFESFLEPQLITHAVHVRVDRETGVTRALRVAAVHDSGRILNPIGASGQVYGGVVMGIGQALTEGMQLDEAGRQRNPHLLDYKLPTAADAPRIDIAWVETPALDGGPNGSKGMGEPPCVPTPGTIANAIARATGARVRQLPMTAERVWEALQ